MTLFGATLHSGRDLGIARSDKNKNKNPAGIHQETSCLEISARKSQQFYLNNCPKNIGQQGCNFECEKA